MGNDIVLDRLNREEAYRYLGFKEERHVDVIADMADCCEQDVLKAARPMYVYKVFDISNITDKFVELSGTSLRLSGKSIAGHLDGCKKAVLMAATVSLDVDRLIRTAQTSDMARAVITDSFASVAIEQVCDKVQDKLGEEFAGYYQTFRFGIGYGDLPITLQKEFLNVLDAGKRIGLNCTGSSMLIPTKSVTAIVGLSREPLKAVNRGCATCNMAGVCKYRKKGGYCNG